MKYVLPLVLVLLCAPVVQAQHLMGRVTDAVTGDPVPLATVGISGTERGVAAGADGRFHLELKESDHMLRVSAIGYESKTVHLERPFAATLDIRLSPKVLSFEEVVVSNRRERVDDPSASPHVQNATEDLMDRIPGADFLQRGNFAWEPVIRGMGGGQIGLVIDGMKVVGACVDKMDPTSAYVEVDNLARLELTKGGFDLASGAQIGGGVNLVTERPSYEEAFHVSTEASAESASMLRRGRVVAGASKGRFSTRASWSYRRADDFRPGASDRIAGSGYEKNNYKVDVSVRPHHAHELTASFLGDNAWGVGYPVLLMDATLAKARMYSLNHVWTPHKSTHGLSVDSRVYYNTVNHWMDDFARDVTDRPVMRGMYMPMYGRTETSGVISKAHLDRGRNRFGLTLDAYSTKSFGDMWMFSVYENIPDMYLLNLGDILVDQGSVAADVSRQLTSTLRGHVSGRVDASRRDVRRTEAIDILEGRWNTDDLARTYLQGNASVSLEYAPDPLVRYRLGLSSVGRFPTHVENYGHYVYNYVDGFFYTGNPDLKPERSWQAELGTEHWGERYGVKATVFGNYIRNYIVGLSDDGLAGNDVYRFRVYRNATAATLIGFEFSGTLGLGQGMSVAASTSYVRGQNRDVGEPLYLMPPMSGMVSLRWERLLGYAELETRWALPQNRVARLVAEEDGTDGYAILNLRASRSFQDHVTVKAGIENLLDTFYHEHLSFGNLPSEGRNVYITVGYDI